MNAELRRPRAPALRRVARCALLTLCALAACHKQPAPPEPAAAGSGSSAASPPLPAQPTQLPAAPPAACRALRVKGDVETLEHVPVATLNALDGRSWLSLASGAELVVRHAASAREYTLKGPGRALPCRDGAEQILLAEGEFLSAKGTGVRPGAEVWLATPFGALRYGDAELVSSVQQTSWQVNVRAGAVFTEAADALAGTKQGELSGRNAQATARTKPKSVALTAACEAAARRAQEEAQGVITTGAAELGGRAARQLRARRDARARCMVAEASLPFAPPETAARLGDQLRRAELQWRAVPSPERN